MPDTLDLSAFKHVVVPVGVVIALGVARIVSAASDYTQRRGRTRFALSHTLWSTTLTLIFVGLWWTVWGLRHIDASLWSFFTLVFLLIGPCFLFMAASLILPDVPDEGTLDLGKQLEDVGRAFFLCMLGFLLWLVAVETWLLQEPWLVLPKRALQLMAFAIFSIGALRPEWRILSVLGVLFATTLIVILATFRANLV